jgi:hypothetical protein
VGTCASGALLLDPASVVAGGSVQATATARCTPGTYTVELTVVGQQAGAWHLGTLRANQSGTLSGNLRIPPRTPPGFARAFVIANFTCPAGNLNCSPGVSGTVTVLPSPKG